MLFNVNNKMKTNSVLNTGVDVTLISALILSNFHFQGDPTNSNSSITLPENTNHECKSVALRIFCLTKTFQMIR